jgi:sugar phosphate isomerase/epimerase
MSRSFYTDEWTQKTDDYSSESIYLIRETCKDAGIILCVENMSLFDSGEYKSYTLPEDLQKLYIDHNKQIKITFDFGHAVSIDPKPELFVEKLGSEKISFGHLSDNNFIKDQHKAVGAGEIDYISFIKTYINKNWKFPLFIETQTAAQTLESKKYLEQIYSQMTDLNNIM